MPRRIAHAWKNTGTNGWNSSLFARKSTRKARATVLDLPQVIPAAREYAAKFGVADRFEYIEGDLHQVDL